MAFPFDATWKFFADLNPKDWLTLVGRSAEVEAVELDSDLSTVSATADKLILIKGPKPSIEHIEVQSGRDIRMPIRVCRYGVLLLYEKRVPINSTVILLRPEADGPELTGIYRAASHDGIEYLQYRYNVIRIWEMPAERFLTGGIGVLPLAFLGKIEDERLPEVLENVRLQVESQLPRGKNIGPVSKS